MSGKYFLSIRDDGTKDFIYNNLLLFVDYINDQMTGDIMKIAKDHYVSAFPESASQRGGGMTNNSENGWATRKQEYTHPILVKTGNLKNSIHIEGDCIVSETAYGEYHNEGVEGRLPRREFLGESDELENKIVKFLEDKIERMILK